MDWALGIATIASILGGAFLFAHAILRSAHLLDTEVAAKSKPVAIEYMQALKAQERAAVVREGQRGLDQWLETAIRHLMWLWPDIAYDRAAKELRDFLDDQIKAWPDPSWDWSDRAAREAAEEYAREYGEQFGSNS